MTNSRQHHNGPTQAQIELLKDLAEETGQSFVWPTTFGRAREEIKRLLAEKRMTQADRRRGRESVSRGFAEDIGDAAAFRDDEIAGHGSTASWAGRHA